MPKYRQGSCLPSTQVRAEGKAGCTAGTCWSCPKLHGQRGAVALCQDACMCARVEVCKLPLPLSVSEQGLSELLPYCLVRSR